MEDILEVYARPYDARFPVICMDESSIKLIGEVRDPIPAAPGHPALMDDEYIRNGVASIFIEVEPLGGKQQVNITDRRTRIDWAHFIKEMRSEVAAWNDDRNNRQTNVDWQFKTNDARIKLKRLYPKL